MERILDQYPIVVEQSVVWSDMDAHGHVNNMIYLRYMENGRVEYYNRIGKFSLEEQTGITLVIKSMTCRYLSSLSYPDTIAIGARVKKIGGDHMVMEYVVVNRSRVQVAAKGEATIVAVRVADYTKVSFPDALKERIVALQTELSGHADSSFDDPSGSNT